MDIEYRYFWENILGPVVIVKGGTFPKNVNTSERFWKKTKTPNSLEFQTIGGNLQNPIWLYCHDLILSFLFLPVQYYPGKGIGKAFIGGPLGFYDFNHGQSKSH